MKCKICSAESNQFANAIIRKKYEIQYFICKNCGFIQTEEPYWLEEAYAEPISEDWVCMVSQNLYLSKITELFIMLQFNYRSRYIDYGGGYGLLVRLMRDKGFNFYRYDPYCQNLFSKGFDAKENFHNSFELATAFEVFEHLANPLHDIENILKFSDSILFSTKLVPKNTPHPEEWDYFDLRNGQHISLYTQKSLVKISEIFGLNLYTDGHSIHILTKKKINTFIFQKITKSRFLNIYSYFLRKLLKVNSLLEHDLNQIIRRDQKHH